MNQVALKSLQNAISKWKSSRHFTYENKQVFAYNSPVSEGEVILKFSNTLHGFYCNDKPVEVYLCTKPFLTASLSDNTLSENPNGDAFRLQKVLEEFDVLFYEEVEKKMDDCIDSLTTSDPLFF